MAAETIVVNLRKEPYDVYIGRAGQGHDGYFGNPYPVARITRAESIANYRKWFARRILLDDTFRQRVLELRGKRMGCFCKPGLCHGDVIVEYLERVESFVTEVPNGG